MKRRIAQLAARYIAFAAMGVFAKFGVQLSDKTLDLSIEGVAAFLTVCVGMIADHLLHKGKSK
jgi:hypothetical protein